MIPDNIINMTISNISSRIVYKQEFFHGIYDIIIKSTSSNGPFAYYNICKNQPSDDPFIHRKTSNNYDIQINWNQNEQPSVYINNDINSYTVMIKIYAY